MIIKTSDIKELCIKISSAIDTADIVALTDLIELILMKSLIVIKVCVHLLFFSKFIFVFSSFFSKFRLSSIFI